MNFLCPSCRTPLPHATPEGVVPCTRCGVQVDLTRMDTAPGTARLWPDMDLTGEALGPYRLTRRLAAGGMGVVYEADGPGGACAVKVLSALLAAEPDLRTRFRREAAALRAIEHPGVVRILEEGEERGFCWYAMERVPGQDLRARIADGPLPAVEVEALARSLLDTLAHVHAKGFVHRDLKPGNILLAPTGPKLCDFGIARFDGSSTLTESAAVLGSLRYMAPEQRLGRTDLRSDLYALGTVLFEALAKGVPGEAELPARVPARLRRLIVRLLAERPLERPADARAALRELDRRATGRVVAGFAAAALVLVVGTAWFVAGTVGPPGGSAQPGLSSKVPQIPEPTLAANPNEVKSAQVKDPAELAGVGNGNAKDTQPVVAQQQAAPMEQAQQLDGTGTNKNSEPVKGQRTLQLVRGANSGLDPGFGTKAVKQVAPAPEAPVRKAPQKGRAVKEPLTNLGTKAAVEATGKPSPKPSPEPDLTGQEEPVKKKSKGGKVSPSSLSKQEPVLAK